MSLTLTNKQLRKQHRQALKRLLHVAGGVSHLSKMLDLPYTTVKGWEERGRISKEGARKVSLHPTLGKEFLIFDLRPDMEEV